jgi:hypothetical protein
MVSHFLIDRIQKIHTFSEIESQKIFELHSEGDEKEDEVISENGMKF